MIQFFEVEGLNERADYKLKFQPDLNILTGRNGSGKTTLLKLLWYSLSGNLKRIDSEINFRRAMLETSSFRLHLRCDRKTFPRTSFVLEIDGETIHSEETETGLGGRLTYGRSALDKVISEIRDANETSIFFPTFRRIEGGYKEPERALRFRLSNDPSLQTALSEFASHLDAGNHRFIASVSTEDVIALLTQKFADLYEQTNRSHINLSQHITETIRSWQTTASGTQGEKLRSAEDTLNDIRTKISANDAERQKIQRPMVVLIKLVINTLRHTGIQITDTITFGETADAIGSDKLSAGEKQMLSFLSFNAFSQKACIFIDEPEISMHVDWQRTLFPTLLEQSSTNQFIVATHSPFIYAKYPDKELQLNPDRGD